MYICFLCSSNIKQLYINSYRKMIFFKKSLLQTWCLRLFISKFKKQPIWPGSKQIIRTVLLQEFLFLLSLFQLHYCFLNTPHREHPAVLYTFISYMSLAGCHSGRRTIFCFRIQYEVKNMIFKMWRIPSEWVGHIVL